MKALPQAPVPDPPPSHFDFPVPQGIASCISVCILSVDMFNLLDLCIGDLRAGQAQAMRPLRRHLPTPRGTSRSPG